MSLGYIEVVYPSRLVNGHVERTTGVRIGRFAVSFDEPDRWPWNVDHIGTGFTMGQFDNSEDAYAFADDLSRFSRRDPTASLPPRGVPIRALLAAQDKLYTQLGEAINDWIDAVSPGRFQPFREWRRG
jgi:hypothetical protein